jgi:hypothetical protein
MAETRLFTQRELILLTQTHDDIQVGVYEVKKGGERGWELRIPYQDKKNHATQYMTLVTARGSIRTFKNLDTVVDYVNEHCSHIQAFGVYLMKPTVTISTRKSIRTKLASKTIQTKKTKAKKIEINKKPLPSRKKYQ